MVIRNKKMATRPCFGDVLWKVGKFSQARYQWRKALDINEDKIVSKRIRKKLILGL